MGRSLAWRDAPLRRGRVRSGGRDRHRHLRHPRPLGPSATAPRRCCAESIATLEGGNRAVAQGNLATMLMDEGKLAEALATYEASLSDVSGGIGARRQMAVALSQMGACLSERWASSIRQSRRRKDPGRWIRRAATKKARPSACTSSPCSTCSRRTTAAALARSQEAEALFRKLNIEAHVAATLHEQGLIYTLQARDAATDDGGGRPTARRPSTASPRAWPSSRRIGNRGRRGRFAGRTGQAADGRGADAGGDRGVQRMR